MKVLTGIIAGMLILLILIGIVGAAILTKGFTEDDPYGVKSQIKDVIGIGGDSQDKPQDNPQDKPQDEPQDEPTAYTFSDGDSVSLSLSVVGKPIYVNTDVNAYQALADYISANSDSGEMLLYALTSESNAVLLITAFIDYDTEFLCIAFKLFRNGQIMQDGTITEEGQFSIVKIAYWNTVAGGWHDQVYLNSLNVKAERVVLSYTAHFPSSEAKYTVANYETIEGLSDVIIRVPAELCNNILSITPFIKEV